MATIKKMARVVIMSRLKHMPYIQVFDDVGILTDEQLTSEYTDIVNKRSTEIQEARNMLNSLESEIL